LSLLLFWLSYGNYALVQGSEFRKQSVQLLKAQDSLIWKQKALDSLAHHASLLQGLYAKQMLAMDQLAPSIDSLRKMAELAGLQVSQLESNPSQNTGFVAIERIGINGTPLQVLQWLKQLSAFHPALQILRISWNGNRAENLELGRWTKGTLPPKASTDRSAYWRWRVAQKQITTTDTNWALPFAYQAPVEKVVEVPVQKSIPSAPVQVQSPAPDLKIVGLVAGRLATVEGASGRRMLRVGDAVGDWVVESISASSLVLRNGERTRNYSAR